MSAVLRRVSIHFIHNLFFLTLARSFWDIFFSIPSWTDNDLWWITRTDQRTGENTKLLWSGSELFMISKSESLKQFGRCGISSSLIHEALRSFKGISFNVRESPSSINNQQQFLWMKRNRESHKTENIFIYISCSRSIEELALADKTQETLFILNGPLVKNETFTQLASYIAFSSCLHSMAIKNDNNCVILLAGRPTKIGINNFYDSSKCSQWNMESFWIKKVKISSAIQTRWGKMDGKAKKAWAGKENILFHLFYLPLLQNNKQKCFMDTRWRDDGWMVEGGGMELSLWVGF